MLRRLPGEPDSVVHQDLLYLVAVHSVPPASASSPRSFSSRPVGSYLDVGPAPAQALGDLGHRPALSVQQQQQEPVFPGQMPQESLHFQPRRRITCRRRHIVLERQVVVVAPFAESTVATVETDSRQPVLERRLGAVGVELSPRLQKRLLGYVFDLFPAAKEAPGKLEHPLLMTHDEFTERIAVAATTGGNQLRLIAVLLFAFSVQRNRQGGYIRHWLSGSLPKRESSHSA